MSKEQARAKTVTVSTPGGSSSLEGAFTYYEAPRILSVSPASGPTTGGTQVTITGTNLDATAIVRMGANATNITVIDSNTVIVTTPPGTVGPKVLSLTTPGGFHQIPAGFSYHAPPTITSVVPNVGRSTSDTQVTITGTNLYGTTSVMVGDVEATSVTVVNDTTITAVIPGTNVAS